QSKKERLGQQVLQERMETSLAIRPESLLVSPGFPASATSALSSYENGSSSAPVLVRRSYSCSIGMELPSKLRSSASTSSLSHETSALSSSRDLQHQNYRRTKAEALRRRWSVFTKQCQNLRLDTSYEYRYRICFQESLTVQNIRTQVSTTLGLFHPTRSLGDRIDLDIVDEEEVEGVEKNQHVEDHVHEGQSASPSYEARDYDGQLHANPGPYYYPQFLFDPKNFDVEDHEVEASGTKLPRISSEIRCFCGLDAPTFHYLDYIRLPQAARKHKKKKGGEQVEFGMLKNQQVVEDEDANMINYRNASSSTPSTHSYDIKSDHEDVEESELLDVADVVSPVESSSKLAQFHRLVVKMTHPACCKHLRAGELLSAIDTPVKGCRD
ncbi:unnamed protein product, partial [Amoebophrya sp. A25]